MKLRFRNRRTWQHLRVFGYRGLRELLEPHGLSVEDVRGAGYYPLPGRVARVPRRLRS